MDANAAVPGGANNPAYDFALWNLVIRPPRSRYDRSQLGPKEFTVEGVRAVRRDVTLRTVRGGQLVCSHFLPRQEKDQPVKKMPVVVYLHGNSSSRLEAGSIVGALLVQGISLFCYDAAGCGLSDGEYVSLGWHERDDLATVLEHLRRSPLCGPIGIWGRSMGAVTALLHADRDPELGALCLDSPFASLPQLIYDLAQSGHMMVPIPTWLVSVAIAIVRAKVKSLADFDIEDLVPVNHASKTFVPAIFMHGKQDNFIRSGHSRQLYDAYSGDKEYMMIEGNHNSERSEGVVKHAVGFFKRAFRLGEVDLSFNASIKDLDFAVPECDTPPRKVSPLPSPMPTVTGYPQLSPQVVQVERDASGKIKFEIEFTPDWQAVLEQKLVQVGLSAKDLPSTLRVYDREGEEVQVFARSQGRVPERAGFPLRAEVFPPSRWARTEPMIRSEWRRAITPPRRVRASRGGG